VHETNGHVRKILAGAERTRMGSNEVEQVRNR
jgi:hypothetical protein